MSEPGQSDRLRIADPAAMQRTIGMRAHARVEASTVRQQSAMFCQIILLIIALEEWDESRLVAAVDDESSQDKRNRTAAAIGPE
jgi:hypothetical protein